MNEIISFDLPMQIKKKIGSMSAIADELKQMSKIYYIYCLNRSVSDIEDEDFNIASILKPKRRKRVEDITTIIFD